MLHRTFHETMNSDAPDTERVTHETRCTTPAPPVVHGPAVPTTSNDNAASNVKALILKVIIAADNANDFAIADCVRKF